MFSRFVRQAIIALRLGTEDESFQEIILKSILEDVQEADNGSESVGTVLDCTPPSFRKIFKEAQLIISKGQANFETLTGTEKTIFFLFQSKCAVVSKELGLTTGSMLLRKS